MADHSSGTVTAAPTRGPDATRDRIISAALRCFSRLTTERATISDIARAANVSRPTIYKYFATKEEIIAEATASKTRAISEYVRTRTAGTMPPPQRLEEAIVACIEFLGEDPMSRDFLNCSVRDLVVMLGTQAVVLAPGRERWMPILEEGVRDGSFAPNLDMERTIAWISDIQTILFARHVNLGDSLDEIRAYIRDYLLFGMVAR